MQLTTHNVRRTGLALVFFATIASVLVLAGSAFAADGNSGNAKLCQKGGGTR
jgi:hypothetical protein